MRGLPQGDILHTQHCVLSVPNNKKKTSMTWCEVSGVYSSVWEAFWCCYSYHTVSKEWYCQEGMFKYWIFIGVASIVFSLCCVCCVSLVFRILVERIRNQSLLDSIHSDEHVPNYTSNNTRSTYFTTGNTNYTKTSSYSVPSSAYTPSSIRSNTSPEPETAVELPTFSIENIQRRAANVDNYDDDYHASGGDAYVQSVYERAAWGRLQQHGDMSRYNQEMNEIGTAHARCNIM
jgi:hypothetical protein